MDSHLITPKLKKGSNGSVRGVRHERCDRSGVLIHSRQYACTDNSVLRSWRGFLLGRHDRLGRNNKDNKHNKGWVHTDCRIGRICCDSGSIIYPVFKYGQKHRIYALCSQTVNCLLNNISCVFRSLVYKELTTPERGCVA